MGDTEQNAGQPAGAAAAAENLMNDQITDALNQLRAILDGADKSSVQVAAYQAFVHVLALAMHNAVAEQQHAHILRMAMTTSAANAILAGRRAEAESILELARSKLVSPDLSDLLAHVRSFVETINDGLRDVSKGPVPPAEPAPAS
jgi:hypothetical protein